MSDDDDLPPPLEDMTEKVEKITQRKQNYIAGINKGKADTSGSQFDPSFSTCKQNIINNQLLNALI